MKHGIRLGPETPGPPPPLVLLVPRFIHTQIRFQRQPTDEVFVGLTQRGADFVEHVAQLPAGDRHPHHIPQELANRRERHVARALEKPDQRRQPRAHQAALLDRRRERRVVDAPATPAPIGEPAMFLNADRRLDDLDLLDDAGRFVRGLQPASAARTGVERIFVRFVHRVGRKRRALVLGMPRLTADLPPALPPGQARPRGFDDVARWRLR